MMNSITRKTQTVLNFNQPTKRNCSVDSTPNRNGMKKLKTSTDCQKINEFCPVKETVNKPRHESDAKKDETKEKHSLPLNIDFEATLKWHKIKKKDLDLDYVIAFPTSKADEIFERLEEEIEYFTGKYTQLKVYNKWHTIPRKQAAYGDEGLTYAFSGNSIPAKPWTPTLMTLKKYIKHLTNREFNFVLVNRYQNGNDHIGEHRDDEKELVENSPIVSVTFGQSRDFMFRHESAKRKLTNVEPLPVYTITLQHGSVLSMNPPTNKKWYHSLPIRKRALGVRINLTFRMLVKKR